MKLTSLENTWAQAALGAMFPGTGDGSGQGGFEGIGAMNVAGFLADAMRTMPLRAALGLRVAVWLVALAPAFVVHRLATLRALSAADRERVVTALITSRSYAVRSLVMILKTIGALLYAGDDRIRAHFRPAFAPAPSRGAALIPLRIKRARTA